MCNCNKWLDVFKHDPPRGEEILFLTGDGEVHIGEVYSEEKIRKCEFRSYVRNDYYNCDSTTEYEERVICWCPIPKQM